jgi:valyl-tRNA synthetase
MISSPAGNDLMWDQAGNEQGKFFINKMWNALKLVKMWEGRQATGNDQLATRNFAVEWFDSRLNEVRAEIEVLYKDFRLSEILKTIYSLIWDDFCSWYLEWVKPGFEQPIDKAVYEKTVGYFEQLLQILHPFMPFITEEIYHQLKEQGDDITVKQYPAYTAANKAILKNGLLLKETITAIRDARNKNLLKPKETIKLHILSAMPENYTAIESILAKQVNAEQTGYTNESVSNTISIVVQKDKFFIETTTELDTASQKEQLVKDLEYQKGFLISVEKKLTNERFVQNAKPEIVDAEKKKKADAEAKIKAIEESLAGL